MSLYDEIVEAELPPGFSTWKDYYASKGKAKKHHKPLTPSVPSASKKPSYSDMFNLTVRRLVKALTGQEPWLVFPTLRPTGYEASFKEGGKLRIEPDRSGQGFYAKLSSFPKGDSYFTGIGASLEAALAALRPTVRPAPAQPAKSSAGQQTSLFSKPKSSSPPKEKAGYDWDALFKGFASQGDDWGSSDQSTMADWGSSKGGGSSGWYSKAPSSFKPLPPPKPLTPEQKKLHGLVDPIRKNPLKRQAAGGIVVKDFSAPSIEDVEILVAKTHQKWGGYWVIPKGGADIDEKIHDTASREVREETGVEAKVVDDTPWSRSSTFGDSGKYDLPLILKTLKDAHPTESEFIDSMTDELKSMSFTWENHSSYFVMQHTGGEPMSEPDENEEMAFATWMPIWEAIKLPRVGEVVENLLPTIERLWQAQQPSEGPMEASLFSRVTGQAEIAEDRLPGGKGDGFKPSDVDPLELAIGLEVEREHTKNAGIALEITLDHLAEDPKYYTKLKKHHLD